MSSVVRLLRRDEYSLASDFIHTHWQADHIYCRSPDLFDWTFGESSYWNDPLHYSFAIAEQDGAIIGILGTIPFLLNHRGQAHLSCWLVNWKVSDNDRGTGAGLRLLRLFKNLGWSTVSFGINDVIERLYRGLRWEIVATIPRFLWVPPTALERMAQLVKLCDAKIPIEDLSRVISVNHSTCVRQPVRALTENLKNEWNESGWEKFSPSLTGCCREFRYLDWRYLKHPIFDYHTAVIPDADRLGLAVWRVETIHHSTLKGLEPIDRITRLVEFLPTSQTNAHDLLSAVRQHAVDVGAVAIDFFGFHTVFNRWIQDDGFVAVDSLPFGNALPSRFQPLDSNAGSIKSALKVGFPAPSVGGRCDWYWTRSDSDQDRPS